MGALERVTPGEGEKRQEEETGGEKKVTPSERGFLKLDKLRF